MGSPTANRSAAQRSVKERLLAWVDGQGGVYATSGDPITLDITGKYILAKLASFADAECRAWAPVAELAASALCSERTVQYRLRDLEAAGLIKRTDRTHRLAQSTRTVPIYQVAPHVPDLGDPKSMGAEPAPIPCATGADEPPSEGYGCKNPGGMGAQGVHPHKDTKDTSSPLIPPSDATAEPQRGLAGKLVAVPPEIRDQIAAHPHFREDFCVSWLDPCRFNPETRELHARSTLARGKIEDRLGVEGLRQLNITLGAPLPRSVMEGQA